MTTLGVLLFVTAAAPVDAGALEEARGAARRCASALADGSTTLGAKCADLFRNRACREAIAASALVHGDGSVLVAAQGCAAVYCPTLPSPRPSLCRVDWSTATPGAVLDDWKTFTAQVAAVDWGPVGAETIAAELRTLRPRAPGRPISETRFSEVRMTVQFAVEGEQVTVILFDNQGRQLGRWTTDQQCSLAEALAQFQDAVSAHVPATERAEAPVALEAERSIRFGCMKRVMHQLDLAGFKALSFGVL